MKLKTKIVVVAICLVVGLSNTNIYAASEITLKLDGVLQQFEVEPISEADNLLLEGKEIAKIVNASYNWDSKEKTITITKGEKVAKYTVGKNGYTLNGYEKYLPTPAKETEKGILLPIRTVSEDFGASVSWNSKTNTIVINTGDSKLSILNTNKPITEKTVVLGFDEAVRLVVAKNSSIRNLQESMDYMELNRKKMMSDYRDASALGVLADSTAISILRSANSIQQELLNIPYNEEMARTMSEYMLLSYLTNINNYEIDIQLLKENVKLQQENVKNINLKNTVGMASDSDLKKAKLELETSKSNLSKLELGIKSQREALNSLIGYDVSADVFVQYNPRIYPVNVDIDSYAIARTSEDPSIKIKENAVKQAQYVYDTSFTTVQNYADPDKDILDKEKSTLELNAASRALVDAKNNMYDAIRSANSNLNQLSENNKSLAVDLQKAKDVYNNTVVNYEAGMVTMYEVNASKLGILKVESDMAKNSYNYNLLLFSFKNPFLLSSGK